MKLSIIVTNHKNPISLKLCLKRIQELKETLNSEILVVDSESFPKTQEIMEGEFPDIKFIPFKKNAGYAKIVNTGIKNSKGEFILILNSDILLIENSALNLIKFLENHLSVGMAGPQLLNFNETPQSSCFRFPNIWTIICRRTFLGKTPFGEKTIDKFLMKDQIANSINNIRDHIKVDWLMGSALMVRRKAIEEIGLMDERFFMYFEDVDWCRRFWNRKWEVVYFPKAKMYHYHQRASYKNGGIKDLLLNLNTKIHLESALKYFLKYKFQ